MVRWLASHHGKRRLVGRSWYSALPHVRPQPFAADPDVNSRSNSATNINNDSIPPSSKDGHSTVRRLRNVHGPRPRFPWRHDLDPLPRLVSTQRDLGGRTGVLVVLPQPYDNWVVNFVTCLVANGGLGIPWYQMFGTTWRNELANAAAFAFGQSVSAVLSHAYQVPWNETSDAAEDDGNVMVNFDSNNATYQQKEDKEDDTILDLSSMLDERLVRCYQSAHDQGRDQIRVQLRMRPVVARLDNVIAVPFLTRAEVAKDPSLQQKFREMILTAEGYGGDVSTYQSFSKIVKFINDKATDMMLEQMQRRDEPIISNTIIAQVVVGCNEAFAVRDVDSDALIQGKEGDGLNPVLHLVRLEMQADYNLETKAWRRGQWIITDWDDILDGNVWFM